MGKVFGFISILALLAVVSCSFGGPRAASVSAPYRITVPQPPIMLDDDRKLDWLCDHYWDQTDFAEDKLGKADSAAFEDAFAQFVRILQSARPDDGGAIGRLMQKAASSRFVTDMFRNAADRILHNPNSPLRSDIMYIPVLEAAIESGFYDEDQLSRVRYTLGLVSLNLPGTAANDFAFRSISGRPGNLYGIEAPMILVFFNNPGCTMCKEIRENLYESPVVSEAVGKGILKILAVYPDEDTQSWIEYAPNIPTEWMNVCNEDLTIREGNLYDLNAIPSLYLLDSAKKVVLKDVTDVPLIESRLISFLQ